jgi:4'-phosphopantetheinyl transferase
MIALPPRNVVHLWHVNLDCDVSELQRLEKLLSRDEEARAARLHFARQRNLFVAARGMLRELLACYINVPAAQIRFAYGAWGKPSLEKHPSLCFNLAHCGTRALVVVAHECEVGVDIERVRTDLLTPALIDLAFAKRRKEPCANSSALRKARLSFDCGHVRRLTSKPMDAAFPCR